MFSNWNWLLNIAAFFAGLNSKQVKQIKQAMPTTADLIDLVTKSQPLIEQVVPLVNAMTPLVEQLLPLVQQATPMVEQASEELKIIGPALEDVLDVIIKHTQQGKTQQQTITEIHQALQRIT